MHRHGLTFDLQFLAKRSKSEGLHLQVPDTEVVGLLQKGHLLLLRVLTDRSIQTPLLYNNNNQPTPSVHQCIHMNSTISIAIMPPVLSCRVWVFSDTKIAFDVSLGRGPM
uniref:Uncharacterized protein n=1 Tax=Mesocestoides corti TaxID=53468 RepID=A0A5K3FQX7_MESCO